MLVKIANGIRIVNQYIGVQYINAGFEEIMLSISCSTIFAWPINHAASFTTLGPLITPCACNASFLLL